MPSLTACAFCEVVQDRRESYHVFEDEVSLAFLDHRPLFPGHCLLVPRGHYETLADLPPDLVTLLFLNAQLLARAVEEGTGAEGSFVALNNRVSQSVPHLHIHVVPRRRKDGLKGFFWPRQRYEDAEAMRQTQEAVRAAVFRLLSSQGGTSRAAKTALATPLKPPSSAAATGARGLPSKGGS